MRVPLDEVVHFDVVTHHPSTAAISDADSTPTFDVYEEATDTGLLGATNLTKRTSLTGNYRGTFTASAANGFEVGKWYSAIASATVNSIAGKAVVMNFMLVPAEALAGHPKVDVGGWLGTAAATPDTAGYVKVTIKDGTGQGEIATTSGAVDSVTTTAAVTTVNGLANNVITAASINADAITAAKIADGAIDAATFAAGAITASAIAADAITDAKVAADVTIASVTGAVGSVTGNVGGNVTGSVGSLAAQAKADVNAEVVDALNVDTYAEPGQEAPGATVSLVKKIGYLYKAWRNKHDQTSSTFQLYADDAATVDQKASVSDDATTFTRGEVASGP